MAETIVFSTPETGATVPEGSPQTPTNRPEWLPENFVSPEDLAKSYKELQAELTRIKQGGQPATPPAGEEAPEGEDEVPKEGAGEDERTEEEKAAEEALKAGGINYSDLETKVTEKGELDPEDYERLGQLGFPKEIVDEFIQHRKEAADRVWNEAMQAAGGEDQFTKMADWVRKSYTPEQINAYNEAVTSGDKAKMIQAVKALRADYEKVHGRRPSFVKPTAASPSAGDRYESMAQFLNDQADPRYKTDPAFRAKVAAKLSRSNI